MIYFVLLISFISNIYSKPIDLGYSIDDFQAEEKENIKKYFSPIVKLNIPVDKELEPTKEFLRDDSLCTGTFVSVDNVNTQESSFILTAAHCLDYMGTEKNISINGQNAIILDIIKGNSEQVYNDYALLKVNISSKNYKIIKERQFLKDDIILIAGYGTTDFGGNRVDGFFRFGFNKTFYDTSFGEIKGHKELNDSFYNIKKPVIIFLEKKLSSISKDINSSVTDGDSGSPLMLGIENNLTYNINYNNNEIYGVAIANMEGEKIRRKIRIDKQNRKNISKAFALATNIEKEETDEQYLKGVNNDDIEKLCIFLRFNQELINKFREFIIKYQ